jgi:hypothetical protein
VPTVRPNFSAIALLESPLETKDAICRRRLVNAANPLALFGRFIIALHRDQPSFSGYLFCQTNMRGDPLTRTLFGKPDQREGSVTFELIVLLSNLFIGFVLDYAFRAAISEHHRAQARHRGSSD